MKNFYLIFAILSNFIINYAESQYYEPIDPIISFPIPPGQTSNSHFYFEQLNYDKYISGTYDRVVLQKTFSINSSSKLLAISDGRYFPINGPAGFLRIKINGNDQHSSFAINDWSTGTTGNSGQHSFNVIAYKNLSPGTYTVSLIASAHPSNNGAFKVGSKTSLSIMVDPSLKIKSTSLNGESNHINLTTYNPPSVDINEGDSNRPYVGLLSNYVTNNTNKNSKVISFISGRSFQSCTGSGGHLGGQGDALWGFWKNGACQKTKEGSWGVNDLYQGAELQSSMYAHSVYSLSANSSMNIKFGASELAFGSDDPVNNFENDVCYKVGNAKLISILNTGISGGVGGNNTACSTYTFKCVGTTIGQPGCPNANTDVTLASKNIYIPNGHSGIMFFSAKNRIQAGSDEDLDMTIRLGIKIDGVKVGSVGIQQLFTPEIASSRSLTASYLATDGINSNRLTPGQHLIEAYINVATSGAKFPSATEDVALTYFDFD